MKRMAQYIAANTMQNMEGCWALVVCTNFPQAREVIVALVDDDWRVNIGQMVATKEGHADVKVVSSGNQENVLQASYGMELNHVFAIGKIPLAQHLLTRLRSRIGNVDKQIHYLG